MILSHELRKQKCEVFGSITELPKVRIYTADISDDLEELHAHSWHILQFE